MKSNIVHEVLENGLNVFLIPLEGKHTVFIDLVVKYGGYYSDFECDNKIYHMEDGMAHLLEHLNFEHNEKGILSSLFGKKQMNTNALTWPHMTEYYVDTVENIDYALDTLITALSKRVFTLDDINKTKVPIYQEIKMCDDQIGRRVLYTRTKNALKNLTYISGIGTKENVENFSFEDIKLCYDVFYQPKNEILVVSGNIEPKKIMKKIKNIYNKLDFKEITFSIPKIEEPECVNKEYEVIKMNVPRDYIDISYKVDFSMYKKKDIRLLTYYLSLFMYMNFSKISPLYEKLKGENVIDGGITHSYQIYGDYLLINVGSYVNDEEKFTSLVKNQFRGNFYSNKEVFDLELKSMKMRFLCSHDSPSSVAGELINNFVKYDYPDLCSFEEINNYNYDDYLKFTNSLKFKHNTITKVVNIEEK